MNLSTTEPRLLWSKEKKTHMLTLWEKSRSLFGLLSELTETVGRPMPLGIRESLLFNANVVADRVADAANTDSYEEFYSSVHDVMAMLKMIVEELYLAKRWNYIDRISFQNGYNSCKTLLKNIREYEKYGQDLAEFVAH